MRGPFERAFATSREAGAPVLATYVMAGDPGIDASAAIALACAEAGAGILEIGVPFSDPIADGPTIAKAGSRALARGATLETALEVARRVRHASDVPIVLMGYANPFFRFGPRELAREASAAGVDALLVPDLPFDHVGELGVSMGERGISMPQLVAPTSTDARIGDIARGASGFLYYVSVTGVTGSSIPNDREVEAGVGRVRATTDLPIVVGFGLREPSQLARLRHSADGFVVGSAIVERAASAGSVDAAVAEVSRLVRSLRLALQP